MREANVQRKIIKYLESIGAYVIKTISTNKAGVPDIIACLNGRFIAIEVKTTKTKNNVSELQKSHINKIRKAGGIAIVAWDINQVKGLLDETNEASN